MSNINKTVKNNLCISCGMCSGVCVKDCINFEHIEGMNYPHIGDGCISCGKCYEICPGKGFDYKREVKSDDSNYNFWLGTYEEILCGKVKDGELLKNAVSGGVVTELVRGLINSGKYTSAFCVSGHEYKKELKSKRISKDNIEELKSTQKSRYLVVSHEDAIKYILSHRNEYVIFVGTSCSVQGLLNVIRTYKLDREKYFIIGLFCDKTMSFNVMDYFRNYKKNRELKNFFFRTKEVGGWPGGVRLEYADGTCVDLENKERMKVKEYFMPERCLYCLDKLNQFADISIGDNYTGVASDIEGSNSIIIRTKKGSEVWKQLEHLFVYTKSEANHIKISQHLEERKNNYVFALMKNKEKGINWVINNVEGLELYTQQISFESLKKVYRNKLKKIQIGTKYAKNPSVLLRIIKRKQWYQSLKVRIWKVKSFFIK